MVVLKNANHPNKKSQIIKTRQEKTYLMFIKEDRGWDIKKKNKLEIKQIIQIRRNKVLMIIRLTHIKECLISFEFPQVEITNMNTDSQPNVVKTWHRCLKLLKAALLVLLSQDGLEKYKLLFLCNLILGIKWYFFWL